MKDGRRRVGGIGRAGGADRRVVAMAERDIGDAALADFAGIADHPGPAVGLQRGVGGVELADHRPVAARAVIGGQQDLGRGGVLQLDEIGLVLDLE